MERQEITEWEYPYNALDGIKNIRKYGVTPAFSHDWERTKENMDSRLEEIMFGVMAGVAICIAIPLGIYHLYRINKAHNKREKQSRRLVADEGFYPEVHENKNQIKRY